MSTSPTRPIRTSIQDEACDVCGRTLLRGERAEIYLAGTDRRSVCELCTSRALHGGWVREGTETDHGDGADRVERRRSLFGRRRSRREAARQQPVEAPPPFGDGFDVDLDPDLDVPDVLDGPVGQEPAAPAPAPDWPEPPSEPSPRAPRRLPRGRRQASSRAGGRENGNGSMAREPRHVRAVPTSVENKIASAIALFNDSEHPKTVSGIGRSLGLPDVSVRPLDPVSSVVHIVVAWELCWYRYEVDLSDEQPTVRSGAQGYELDELSPVERQVNATADERGRLATAR